jgi:hypothetical protein
VVDLVGLDQLNQKQQQVVFQVLEVQQIRVLILVQLNNHNKQILYLVHQQQHQHQQILVIFNKQEQLII